MTEEALIQASKLFDTKNKWEAFLMLTKIYGNIRDNWRNKLITNLRGIYDEFPNSKWSFQYRENIVTLQHQLSRFKIEINFWERKVYLNFGFDDCNINKIHESLKSMQTISSKLSIYRIENGLCYTEFDTDICVLTKDTQYSYDLSCWMWGHETLPIANKIANNYIIPFTDEKLHNCILQLYKHDN